MADEHETPEVEAPPPLDPEHAAAGEALRARGLLPASPMTAPIAAA